MRNDVKIDPIKRVFVALDTSDFNLGLKLAQTLKGKIGGIKIGKEFFTAHGPEGTKKISDTGLPIFLDLKFHDIPNTVAGAVRASMSLNPFLLNVHAAGGRAMLEAAKDAAAQEAELRGIERPLILAVTVLTSLDEGDFKEIGLHNSPEDQVRRLANLAQECGVDGVVCSAREIDMIRESCGKDFKILTPGVRPRWTVSDDQKRVDSPFAALSKGADYLVIGRPVTRSNDPLGAVRLLENELNNDGRSKDLRP